MQIDQLTASLACGFDEIQQAIPSPAFPRSFLQLSHICLQNESCHLIFSLMFLLAVLPIGGRAGWLTHGLLCWQLSREHVHEQRARGSQSLHPEQLVRSVPHPPYMHVSELCFLLFTDTVPSLREYIWWQESLFFSACVQPIKSPWKFIDTALVGGEG